MCVCVQVKRAHLPRFQDRKWSTVHSLLYPYDKVKSEFALEGLFTRMKTKCWMVVYYDMVLMVRKVQERTRMCVCLFVLLTFAPVSAHEGGTAFHGRQARGAPACRGEGLLLRATYAVWWCVRCRAARLIIFSSTTSLTATRSRRKLLCLCCCDTCNCSHLRGSDEAKLSIDLPTAVKNDNLKIVCDTPQQYKDWRDTLTTLAKVRYAHTRARAFCMMCHY